MIKKISVKNAFKQKELDTGDFMKKVPTATCVH